MKCSGSTRKARSLLNKKKPQRLVYKLTFYTMEYLQIENDLVAIILIILAVLIPVAVIFWTMRRMRIKREKPSEEPRRFGKKFESVKEERLKKSKKDTP